MKTSICTLALVFSIAATAYSKNQTKEIHQQPASRSIFMNQIEKSTKLQNEARKGNRNAKYYDTQEILKHSAEVLLTYNWDSFSDTYELYTRESFKYDEGKVVEIIREIPDNNDFIFIEKETFTYHLSGELSEKVYYYFDFSSETWQKSRRQSFEYDTYGNMTLETHSDWDNSKSDWDDYYKFRQDFEYNEDGNPSKITAYFWSLFIPGNQWHPSYMDEYYFDDLGRQIEAVYSIPDGQGFEYSNKEEFYYLGENTVYHEVMISIFEYDEWIIQYKVTDVSWFDINEKLLESITVWVKDDMSEWKSENWEPFFRLSFEYNPITFEESLFLEEFFFYDAWIEVYRMLSSYNEHNFKVKYVEEYNFSYPIAEWEIDSGYCFNGEFDNQGQPVELLLSVFDWWEGLWLNYNKFVFGENQEDDNTTRLPIFDNGLTVRIYPNPAKDVLYIDANNSYESIEIRIYDISGKLVNTTMLFGVSGSSSVNISELRQGLYLVKISSGGSLQHFKLLKQ